MRIARVLTRLNLGGPARQVLASDPRLAAQGHTLRVFAGESEPGEGDLAAEARARGIDVVRVPGLARGIAPAGDLSAARFLARALAEFRPDVVHTHASKAGALGRLAARKLGAARVHTFHGHVLEGYFGETLARGIAALERRLARGTDRVVAVSHATADDLVRLGVAPEEKIVVIPPGIELEPLLALESARPRGAGPVRRQIGAGERAFVVAVIGRLAGVKRPLLAVDVYELLRARYPDLHVVFVGDGSERRALERRILALDETGRAHVHMLGAVEDMTAIYAEIDLVLLTSENEGLPVALIEAGAAGLPVVATPVGGVPELVAEERTGFLGAGADELAYGIARVLELEDRGGALGQRARMRVRARYSAEALVERLQQLYAAVIEERACAS